MKRAKKYIKQGLQCFEKNVLPFLHVFFLHPTCTTCFGMFTPNGTRHTTHINHIQAKHSHMPSTSNQRKTTLHHIHHERRITAFCSDLINTRACRACRACIVSRFSVLWQMIYRTPFFQGLPLRCLFSNFIYNFFLIFYFFIFYTPTLL